MEEQPREGFRRTVYTKMYHSSISALQRDQERPKKKILPSIKKSGLREEFKKTFLPLLIDLFELRQMIRNYKKDKQAPSPLEIKEEIKCPKKVLARLEQLQQDVEESQRWCTGMIMQISEAINEAKAALENVEVPLPEMQKYSLTPSASKKEGLWCRLVNKMKSYVRM